jgi:predicted GH43/DUF377 family glycosyl hydrolase
MGFRPADSPHLLHLCRTREDYRELWEAQANGLPPPPPERRFPCRHLGKRLTDEGTCLQLATHECAVHSRCRLNAPRSSAGMEPLPACAVCPEYDPTFEGCLAPAQVWHIPVHNPQALPCFNNSILQHRDRLLMAYRLGWARARVALCELDPLSLGPRWHRTVDGPPMHAHAAHEDPRLFVHRGRLHCSYVGYGPIRGGSTDQMVMRLTDDYRPEHCWRPDYDRRQPVEKNWQFFEWSGELFAVYSIAPHRVLHLVGGRAYPFSETNVRLPWDFGVPRGGACPVRVGDEFYSFFHGVRPWRRHEKLYALGCYTFAAQPPFAIRRMTPRPLLLPREEDRPPGWQVSVVFPCGAVLRDGRWHVSYGYHDRWPCVAAFDADLLDQVLQPVGQATP